MQLNKFNLKLTSKQLFELKTIIYFIPENCKWDEITEDNIKSFFSWSDKGIGGIEIKKHAMSSSKTGLCALYWGKQRRDLQIKTYLEDWGTLISEIDFVDEPECMVIMLAKAMSKPKIHKLWKRKHDAI